MYKDFNIKHKLFIKTEIVFLISEFNSFMLTHWPEPKGKAKI